ncbi:uncharacterized protein LOC110701784 [Chenopodium quinoa]|uniref:uncharacterized protein LOC110701784 n=1 Tax=Chenopodium quinoa TaxID=63459 RepID=UPI000B774C7B|nr:uncharacterized protein LOC110701784 [Chenopodium quinoa]
MEVDVRCPMCGECCESTLHMLVHCEDARFIWYTSPLRLEVGNYVGDSFREWCCSVRVKYKDPGWGCIFWCIAWGVWLRRNRWAFDRKRLDKIKVIRKAVGMVGEFEHAKEVCNTNPSPPTFECVWKPPLAGIIKINSDAAVFSPSGVGLEGVMRDSVGDVVASTCSKIDGCFDVDVVEALAMMRHSLYIAMEAGFRCVSLETDCLKLHNHLVKGLTTPTTFGVIVNDMLKLAQLCQSCCYSFVKRGGNKVAHALAKCSINFVGFRVWMEKFPPDVTEFVVADLSLMV